MRKFLSAMLLTLILLAMVILYLPAMAFERLVLFIDHHTMDKGGDSDADLSDVRSSDGEAAVSDCGDSDPMQQPHVPES